MSESRETLPALHPDVELVLVGDEAVVWDSRTSTAHLLDPLAAALVIHFDGVSPLDEFIDDVSVTWERPVADVTAVVRSLVDRMNAANALSSGT